MAPRRKAISRTGVGLGVVLFVGLVIVAARVFVSSGTTPALPGPSLPGDDALAPAYTIFDNAFLSFSADGKTIVTIGGDQTTAIEIYDLATGALRYRIAQMVDWVAMMDTTDFTLDWTGFPNSAVLSPDGTRLLTASFSDPAAHLYRLADGSRIDLVGHSRNVGSIAFAPDGDLIATGSGDGTVRLWDRAGTSLAVLQGPGAPIDQLLFSPDHGARLAVHLADGQAQLWDASTHTAIATLAVPGHLDALSFSPDGSRLLAVEGPTLDLAPPQLGGARLWDAATGAPGVVLPPAGPVATNTPGDQVDAATFAPDGATIAVAGAGIQFLSATTGERVDGGSQWPATNAAYDRPRSVSYAPDGALILVSYYPIVRYAPNGALSLGDDVVRDSRLFAADGRAVARLDNGSSPAWISPDGRFVVSSTAAGVTVWRMPPTAAPAPTLEDLRPPSSPPAAE